MTTVLTTERLALRLPTPADGAFLVALTNDPTFVEHIGERGLVTAEDGARFVEERLLTHQAEHGFGLWVMERRDGPDAEPLGLCGLLRRPFLEHVDVGFALLPAARGQGYAGEAARACLTHGRERLGLDPIVAIVSPTNAASRGLLARLGMVPWRSVLMPDEDRPVELWGPPPPRPEPLAP